jgi:hypothetical protein
MNGTARIRLVLVDPPAGVDYGIQKGSGNLYETLFIQRPTRGDVVFDFELAVKGTRPNGQPNFTGPLVQGPPPNRFIYVDVGTYAGQKGTPWSRRMKVPLGGVTTALLERIVNDPASALEARIPGTAKDGGPNCATVGFLEDWKTVRLR